MDKATLDLLAAAGVDAEALLERVMGSEKLAIRFLRMFTANAAPYEGLRRAVVTLLALFGTGAAYTAFYIRYHQVIYGTDAPSYWLLFAVVLAVALGLLLSLPVRPGLLRRPADSPHQTGLSAAQRQRNAAGSFQAADVRGLHLWLVDDIITTGSTLRAACAELRRAGAARVDVLALARTPRP